MRPRSAATGPRCSPRWPPTRRRPWSRRGCGRSVRTSRQRDQQGSRVIAQTTAVIEPGGVLGELACAPPLTLRQVHGGGRCELRLVGTAAGPLPGDDLSLSLRLRPGAQATLRATGASLAQGRDHGGAAALSIRADLAENADLAADPGALIVCQGSQVDVRVELTLRRGAAVDWRELIVMGST